MNHVFFKIQFLAAYIAMISCSQPDQESASHLNHSLGKTLHQDAKPPQCIKKKTNFPEELSYLRKIAKHLINSNINTFSEGFSFKNFCFYVRKSLEINAESAADGTTIVNRGIFKLTTDAQIAAIVAHELAHYTRAHHTRKMNIYDREVEADEVGYEFYRRAGFNGNQFKKMFAQIGGGLKCPKYQEGVESISRDNTNHPSLCERIGNVEDENTDHHDAYSQIPTNKNFITNKTELQKLNNKLKQEQLK